MSVPEHVRRAVEEQAARSAFAKHRAGAFASVVLQGADDLQQSGDEEAADFARKARGLASELEGFATAPAAVVPADGTIHVAVIYGPGDRANAQEVVNHLFGVTRMGGTVAAVPLQAASFLSGRVHIYLPIVSPEVVAWAASSEGLQQRAACRDSADCIVVPLDWRDVSMRGTWLDDLAGLPRYGSVTSGDRDEQLAGVARALREVIEQRGWLRRPR